MAKKALTFKKLRQLNSKRSNEVFPVCTKWGVNEWAVALFGEVGEVCDAVKKYNRGKNNVDDIAKELADTIFYADLLANHLGIDLEEAVKQKFNEVSDKMGSKIKME